MPVALLPIRSEQLLLNLTGLFRREEVVARHHHSLAVWVFELSCPDLIKLDEPSNPMAHLAKRGEIGDTAQQARFCSTSRAVARPRWTFNLCPIPNSKLWSQYLPAGSKRDLCRYEHFFHSGSCKSYHHRWPHYCRTCLGSD